MSKAFMQRIAYLDNLRSLIVLLVVLLHTLLPYSFIARQLHYQWSGQVYHSIDYMIYFIHAISMPLFFLLSGFFAHTLMSKKNIAYFINERLVRLGIPFIVSLILLAPIHFVVFSQYIWDTLCHAGTQSFWQAMQMATAHGKLYHAFLNLEYLWFIYYLLIYSAIAIVLRQMKIPLINLPYPIISLSLILTAFIAIGKVPYIATPQYLLPLPQVFLSYGLFFYFGWLIYSKQTLLSDAKIPPGCYLSIGILSLSISLYLAVSVATHILIALTLAFALVNLCFGTLLFFYRYVNQPIRVCRYLAEISYWIYLTRIPILLCCQFFILRSSLNMGWQLVLGFFSALGLSMLSYQLLVLPSFLKKYLKGQHQLKFMRKWTKCY